MQVYEADTLARFSGHCNIVSLYSFWSEKSQNPYTFKTLTVLMEEGILGDMLTTVVRNPKRPPNRIALKYLCDIAKGIIAVHNCNIIHARVKPSSMYLRGDNTAMVGEFGKVPPYHRAGACGSMGDGIIRGHMGDGIIQQRNRRVHKGVIKDRARQGFKGA